MITISRLCGRMICVSAFAFMVLAFSGIYHEAQAQTAGACMTIDPNNPGNPSATPPVPPGFVSQMSQYGFTAGVVYCVKQNISSAVQTYLGYLTTAGPMVSYKYLAITVALIFFGIKLASANVEHLTKEGMTVLFKIAIVLFLIDNAYTYYTYLILMMDQMISWISSGFTMVTAGNTTCTFNPSGLSTLQGAASYANEYLVWEEYDCMFQMLFGVALPTSAAPSTLPVAPALVSAAAIVAISLFSGTLGISVFIAGITLFLTIVFMLLRSLFLVLLAYFTLGLLMVLTPVVAPILLFESEYLTNMFKRWVGLIVSTLFQPVFVIGFLSFAVFVLDAFVEGTAAPATAPTAGTAISITAATSSTLATFPIIPMGATTGVSGAAHGCVLPDPFYFTLNGTSVTCNASPGSTTAGSGVCSLNQILFNVDKYANQMTPALQQSALNCIIEPNARTATLKLPGDPQGHSSTSTALTSKVLNGIMTSVISVIHQFSARTADINVGGYTRLRGQTPFYQLLVTLVAFALVAVCMYKLIDKVPAMARSITVNIALDLSGGGSPPSGVGLEQSAVPFEGTIMSGVRGMGDAMKKEAAGTGLLRGNLPNPLSIAQKGLGGFLKEAGGFFIKRPFE